MSVTMATFAPRDRHESACETIFCGSFRAFVIEEVTLAFFSALAINGASNCTQRTDDLVSGSRTQTWMFAELLATASVAKIATTAAGRATARPAATDLRKIRFTGAS